MVEPWPAQTSELRSRAFSSEEQGLITPSSTSVPGVVSTPLTGQAAAQEQITSAEVMLSEHCSSGRNSEPEVILSEHCSSARNNKSEVMLSEHCSSGRNNRSEVILSEHCSSGRNNESEVILSEHCSSGRNNEFAYRDAPAATSSVDVVTRARGDFTLASG